MINIETFTIIILLSLIILLLIRFNKYKKITKQYEFKLLNKIEKISNESFSQYNILLDKNISIKDRLLKSKKKLTTLDNIVSVSKIKLSNINSKLISISKELVSYKKKFNSLLELEVLKNKEIKNLKNDVIRINGMHKLSLDEITKLESKIKELKSKSIKPKRKYVHHNSK